MVLFLPSHNSIPRFGVISFEEGRLKASGAASCRIPFPDTRHEAASEGPGGFPGRRSKGRSLAEAAFAGRLRKPPPAGGATTNIWIHEAYDSQRERLYS